MRSRLRPVPPTLCRMSTAPTVSAAPGPALLPESLQRLKRGDAVATIAEGGRRRRCRASAKSSVRRDLGAG